MVMPSMPMLLSASLTSSSLNGWMTASIFFISLAYPLRRLPFESIPLLAVHAQIQALDLLVPGDAHSDEEVADLEDNQGADYREDPCDGAAGGLVENLAGVAIHQAQRQGMPGRILETIVHQVGGEDAGEERAQSSTGAVDAEGIERVVVSENSLDLADHEITNHAGAQADEEGGERLDEPGSRGDGHQSRDGAGNSAQDAGLAVVDPFRADPAQGGGGGSEMRGHEGAGGQAGRRQGAAGVEAEPPDPQQARADDADHQVMRLHGFAGIANPLPQVERAHQGGDAGGDVHHGAAGEIETGNAAARSVQETALAPYHVGEAERAEE